MNEATTLALRRMDEIGIFEDDSVKNSRFTEIFYAKLEIFAQNSKFLLDLVEISRQKGNQRKYWENFLYLVVFCSFLSFYAVLFALSKYGFERLVEWFLWIFALTFSLNFAFFWPFFGPFCQIYKEKRNAQTITVGAFLRNHSI